VLAGLAIMLACLTMLSAARVSAQPDDAAAEAAASAPDAGWKESGQTAANSSDLAPELEPEAPPPLIFEPLHARKLTSADFPPANPLYGFVRTTNVVFGRDWRAGRNEYRPIIEREALAYGLPPALLDAVMAVESRYNPAVIGNDGEIGLMQVMPATARMLGFAGTEAQLANPEVNIHYGAKYLAGAWRLAAQDLCTAAMKYRAGHGETRFSPLSVSYCSRVRNHLAANGVPVTGTVPQPNLTPRTPGAPPRNRPAGRLSSGGSVNFAALNARLRTVTDTVRIAR
jgi:soluble lytic murein transglycosylase-like protein